jgi:plastocyanin
MEFLSGALLVSSEAPLVSKKIPLIALTILAFSSFAGGDTLILTRTASGSQKVSQINASGVLVDSAVVSHRRNGDSFAIGQLTGALGYDVVAMTYNATTQRGAVNINRYDASNEFVSTQSFGKAPIRFDRILGLGDFDLDGRWEVVTYNGTSGERGLYLFELQNNGSVVKTAIPMETVTMTAEYRPIGVSDMDADGDTDVAVQNQTTRKIKFVRFNGVTPVNTLAAPTLNPANFGGTSTFAADTVFDVNGNGVGDLFSRPDVASQNGKSLWFLNSNLQRTGAAVNYLVGTSTLLAVGGGSLAQPVIEVNISSSAFAPKTVNANAGATIRWKNSDFFAHTVTTDVSGTGPNSDVQFPNGFPQNQTYSFVIPANAVSGTKFFYHCRFHGSGGNGTTFGTGMSGVIIVN